MSGGIEITGESGSPLIGGVYKAIKTILPVFLLTAAGFLSVSVQGNTALAKTSIEIGDERARLPAEYIGTAERLIFIIIKVEIGEEIEIMKEGRPDLYSDFYRRHFKTLEDVYKWSVEIEKYEPGVIISKKIKDKINKLGEEVQRTFNTRSDKILNILNNLKYSLAGPGMKTEEIKVGSLPGELKRGFAEALRNIEKKPDALLYWIDEAVNALSEARTKKGVNGKV